MSKFPDGNLVRDMFFATERHDEERQQKLEERKRVVSALYEFQRYAKKIISDYIGADSKESSFYYSKRDMSFPIPLNSRFGECPIETLITDVDMPGYHRRDCTGPLLHYVPYLNVMMIGSVCVRLDSSQTAGCWQIVVRTQ